MPSLWRDKRFYLLLLLSLLLIGLAYQVRLPAWVNIGSCGDRAYLWASPLGEERGFNGDEHLIAEGFNYRWTKRVSWVRFPDMGWNGPFQVTLRFRAWRPQGSPLPRTEIRVNGVTAERFTPTGQVETRRYTFSEYPGRPAGEIEVLVQTVPFTPAGKDRRLLGVQWDWVRLEPLPGGRWPVLPPWRQWLLWPLTLGLLYVALRRFWGRHTCWPLLGLALLLGVGLALVRHLLTPYLLWALGGAAALLGLTHLDRFRWVLWQAGRRSRPSAFFALLLGGGLIALVAYIRWAVRIVPTLGPRPDAVLLIIFVTAAGLYALLTWDQPLRRLLARLDRTLRRPWLPAVLLLLLLAGITAYEFLLLREMQFVGHADYADNAVVARNLLAGRGFVVDYVAQFYRPYPDISHPQETWPLLQPVLIAPFFRLLGDSPFAAKFPNLVLQLGLALVLYLWGSEFLDRRVALTAVLLTLLNPLMLRLVLFPTSDLAFTLLALATLGQFFRAVEAERHGRGKAVSFLWAGIWAGLMMLAKPTGALFVAIALLWDLWGRWREYRRRGWLRYWLAFGLPAALLVAPWVGRNLLLFGRPVHSTEAYDAWILKYQEWEEIYRIYFDDLPDRSWLLRYGFDRVLEAVATEFRRWWTYLARSSHALMTLWGSLLGLGGLLTLRKKAARLYGLVGLVFVLFGTFICTYWHVEERYFVPFIPWLALLVAHFLWKGYDTLAYAGPTHPIITSPPDQVEPPPQEVAAGRRMTTTGFSWLGFLLLLLVLGPMVSPFFQEARSKLATDQSKRAEIRAYLWLQEHTDPDAVVMTRVPWQVTYYSRRRTVMIPQDGLEDTLRIANLYGVEYLLMDGDARGKRPRLQQALGDDRRFDLLYDIGNVQIYRMRPDEPPVEDG